MSDDPLRASLGKLVDEAHAPASMLDSIDLTEYDIDALNALQDMIDDAEAGEGPDG